MWGVCVAILVVILLVIVGVVIMYRPRASRNPSRFLDVLCANALVSKPYEWQS